MKIGTGVEGILRFCLKNLWGCNIGISDEGGLMDNVVEMRSGAMIYKPSFIKTGSDIQKWKEWENTHTKTKTWASKPTFIFENKESGLKWIEGSEDFKRDSAN
jgi:hypothetical protein